MFTLSRDNLRHDDTQMLDTSRKRSHEDEMKRKGGGRGAVGAVGEVGGDLVMRITKTGSDVVRWWRRMVECLR